MAKIRKIYDQTIKPDGTKVTIYPITSTRAVYTPEGITLDKYIQDGYFHGADLAGYKVVYELSELPLTETSFGYLMGSNLYVWVGTGGDTLGGKYQNCGPFKGPKGDAGNNGRDGRDGVPGLQGIQGPQGPAGLTGSTGPQGPKGDSGVSLGEVALTTDLNVTETGSALDASAMQTIPSMVDVLEEIEDVPSNYYTKSQTDALIDAQRIARQQKELEQDAEISNFENTITDIINGYKPVEIYGNVNNAPDGEDLTAVDGRIKFANRPCLNGMGYIILRNNGGFAEQLTQENTIYEIKYNFDLYGESITIPENSVLRFNGGSLINGTIVGQNTKFEGGSFRDITLTGSYDIVDFHTEWFNVTDSDADLAYNNKTINMLVDLLNTLNDGRRLIVDRDLAISTGIEVHRFSLVCAGMIKFYNLPENSSAIILNDTMGNTKTRKKLNHTINCRYMSLSNDGVIHDPADPGDMTIEDFAALNIAGLQLFRVDYLDTTITVEKICNFPVGIWFAPGNKNDDPTQSGFQAAAVFENVVIQNSYIGLKFDKKNGYTNYNTIKAGVIYNFTNFVAYQQNTAIQFKRTTNTGDGKKNFPYASCRISNLQIDAARIGIDTDVKLISFLFDNLRVEGIIPQFIYEHIPYSSADNGYNDCKSIVIIDSDYRFESADTESGRLYYNNVPYKSFIVVKKAGLTLNQSHFNIKAVGTKAGTGSFLSCNLPIINYTTSPGTTIETSYLYSVGDDAVGFNVSGANITNFTSTHPAVILDVSKVDQLCYKIIVKAISTADSSTQDRIYITGVDSDNKKVNLWQGFSSSTGAGKYFTETNIKGSNISSTGSGVLQFDLKNGYGQTELYFKGIANQDVIEDGVKTFAGLKYLYIGFRYTPESVWLIPMWEKELIIDCERPRLYVPEAPVSQFNNGFFENIYTDDRELFYDGSTWKSDVATTIKKVRGYGGTSNRPTNLTTSDRGFIYFDTYIQPNRPVFWTGSGWVDATGTSA